jgi:ABC-type sugar transport system substrate-binding protein
MKKALCVLCSIWLFAAAFTGCSKRDSGAQAKEEGGKLTIAYAAPMLNGLFQVYLVDGAKAYAEKNEIEIVVSDAQTDVIKQQDQVRAFVQRKVDAIVVVPCDSSGMEPITEMCLKAKIPLVYCNVPPFMDASEIPDGVYYVGSDEDDSGRIQGELLGEAMNGKGNVALIMGGLAYQASYRRTNGVKALLAEKYPGVNVLAEQTGDWLRDKAVDVTNNFLSAYGNQLTGIGANSDEMALGALQALKAAGRTDVVVVGIDAVPDACAAIVAGEMKGSVFQDATGQAEGAMDLAARLARGETIAEKIRWIPFIRVDASNVKDFM